MRRIAAGALVACLAGCGAEEPLPLPPTPRPALLTPPQACVEAPQPPPEAVLHGSEVRDCVPAQYVVGLPLEVTVSGGKVAGFRFYSHCEGRVYDVEPQVRACIQKAIETWWFDYFPPTCSGTTSRPDDVQHAQLYIMPLTQPMRRPGLSAGIGLGCSAG